MNVHRGHRRSCCGGGAAAFGYCTLNQRGYHVEAADNLHVLPSLSSPVWDRSEGLVRVDVQVSDKNLVSLIASRYKGGSSAITQNITYILSRNNY